MLGTLILTGADLLIGAVPSVRYEADDDEAGDAMTGADDIGMADPLSITSGADDVADEAIAPFAVAAAAFDELVDPHPAAQTAITTDPSEMTTCALALRPFGVTSGIGGGERPQIPQPRRPRRQPVRHRGRAATLRACTCCRHLCAPLRPEPA